MKSKQRLLIATLIVGFAALGSFSLPKESRAQTGSGKALPAGSYRVKLANIVDAQGFGRRLVAATVLIPSHWQSKGGITWPRPQLGKNCGVSTPSVQWQASSPDGQFQFQVLPSEVWQGSNMATWAQQNQQCPNVQIRSAKVVLHEFVKRSRPGAKVYSYRDRPDINKEFASQTGQHKSFDTVTTQYAQTGEILIGYQQNGQEYRESLIITTIFQKMSSPGIYAGEVREFYGLQTEPGVSFRAPAGQLDFKLLELIRKSGVPQQEWLGEMAKHMNKMNSINTKGSIERHKIRMDGIRAAGEISRRGYEGRKNSGEASQRRAIQAIRGVQSFRDSSGTHIELPDTYKQAWQLPDNTYIMSDNPNFDPNVDLGINAQLLKPNQ